MLIIRLSRTGRKNQPYYRILVQEKQKDPQGKYIEIVGNYNSKTNPPTIVLKEDRIKYWISKGAQASNTVHNILVNAKIVNGKKRKVVKTHPEPVKAEPKKEESKKEEAKPVETPKTEAPKEEKKPETPPPHKQ
jgi:small subunit ribosomal protein S16